MAVPAGSPGHKPGLNEKVARSDRASDDVSPVSKPKGALLVSRRLSLLVLALVIAAPVLACAEPASPKVVACHNEATQRYIADFRQVGRPERRFDNVPVVVTSFENANPRYEEYFSECLARGAAKQLP